MRYLIPIVIILVLVYCGVFLKNLDRDISQISFPLAIEKEIVIEGNIIEKLKKDLEKLYFTTDKGFLYCFDPAEKEILWKINIGRKEIITPPYVGKKNIYFLTKDELFCVNKNDGKLIWKKSFNNSKVIHLSEFRGNLYIAFNNKIQIRKSENGEITKEYEIEYPINSKIIIWTNNLIFLSIDGRIYSIPRNGRIQNLIKLSENITSDLLKDENFLYFGSDDYFYCYDLSRNRVKWKIRTGGRVACSPIVDEKRIYFACLNNVIFCLNKKGGDILWWKSIPSRVLFQLSLGRNILLVPILGDKFLAFN
ncbi:PQQ-binding-like beta-propeller repeat protein, partial [SCandidatus Aminicenantes bacterium Aminicenantia_JdfR_composite]|nr:PQQ-binding-like beta-propeller repeat protein [SCandidatus Aminicenantes bacterium Aminicenantia_JdfR_composite]